MAVFFLAIYNCGAVSSSNSIRKRTILAGWRRILHITPLLYKVYLPVLHPGFCWTGAVCLLYILLRPGHLCKQSSIFSHVNAASKNLFVSVIDIYVTFHHRSSLIPVCKMCSKLSWSCMGTHDSTMLVAPLKKRLGGRCGGWMDSTVDHTIRRQCCVHVADQM